MARKNNDEVRIIRKIKIKKEEAVLKLYALGCSSDEIDGLIHIETLRRKKEKEMQKKLAIAEIIKNMELKKGEKKWTKKQ